MSVLVCKMSSIDAKKTKMSRSSQIRLLNTEAHQKSISKYGLKGKLTRCKRPWGTETSIYQMLWQGYIQDGSKVAVIQ